MNIQKILTLLLLLSLTMPSIATTQKPQAPQWAEFCPPAYVYAEYQEATYNELTNGLLAASLIGLPIAMNNHNKYLEALDSNYWVNRREQFNTNISYCNSITNNDNIVNCYMQVKSQEYAKNSEYNNNEMMAAMASKIVRSNNYNNFQTTNRLNQLNTNVNNLKYNR